MQTSRVALVAAAVAALTTLLVASVLRALTDHSDPSSAAFLPGLLAGLGTGVALRRR